MHADAPRVRHIRETLLSDNWYTLKKYTFELLRRDGRWQEQSREAYDRGNGAVILLYNREKQTVVLVCFLCAYDSTSVAIRKKLLLLLILVIACRLKIIQ